MSRSIRHFLFVAISTTLVGCSTPSICYTPGVGWSWGPPIEADHENAVDQAWRAGAGKNNPNVERLREGKRPLNFDGSVY